MVPVIPGVLWKYLQFLPSAFIKHCHFDFLNIITAYVQQQITLFNTTTSASLHIFSAIAFQFCTPL